MSAMPWAKFFWDDWESDEALKMCSPGAQALWMRMLCVCAKADGFLMIAGQKLGADDMARLTGWPTADVQKWWDELKRWGVYSVEGRGKVFSRRLVRDAKRSRTARENGKNGGNPSLRKDRDNPGWDNPRITDSPTQPLSLTGAHTPATQKPEARVQKDREERPEIDQPQLNGVAVLCRAARLPPDWRVDPEGRTYAAAEGFADPEIDRMGQDFRDYWTAKAGKDGAKLDWQATWRRWVRTQRDRRPTAAPKRVGFV